jgi:hypothetical protein
LKHDVESHVVNRIRPRFTAIAIFIALPLSLANASKVLADDLEQMRLAAQQLAGSQLSSGLLDFDFDFASGEENGSGNTDIERSAYIAREAGSTYVLAKYLALSRDTRITPVIQRLITTLGSLSLPVSKSTSQRLLEGARLLSIPIGRYKLQAMLTNLGLLYEPRGRARLLSYEGGYQTAWVGSTALALLAELEYFRATGDNQFAELRSAWLDGLRILHVPGRGFREYPASIDEVAYGNGESWLALASYAAMFPADERARDLLSGYDDYVLEKYSTAPNRQFFSWGMMAATKRLESTSGTKFEAFIATQATHFVDLEVPAAQRSDNSCAFVEGLVAAASVLGRQGSHGDLIEKLISRTNLEMMKNRALQIPSGTTQLDFPSGASFRSPRLGDFAGAYLIASGNLYSRIDITAHCLNALMELHGIPMGR